MKKIKTSYIFQRVEKKYMISKSAYLEFLNRILPYIKPDEYGPVNICNIYYDTDNFDLIRTSIGKPLYKEKLRLRSYGIPNENDTVFLEIKKKCNGIVYKRRIDMKEAEAEEYMNNGKKPESYNQILNEIDYFIKYYKPEPKLFLAYDRIAYSGKYDSDLRITFDSNIRSREYDLDLKKGDYGELLLEEDYYLMEIKASDSMPLWLARTLSDMKIFPTSFSKYGKVYMNNLATVN